jgi:hypothetical protein
MKGTFTLSQRLKHQAEGLNEVERERFLVNRRNLAGMRHRKLAEAILFSPPFQRFDTVFGLDRFSVMPSESIAQRERKFHAIRRYGRPIDHLRFDPKILVCAEESVVNEKA